MFAQHYTDTNGTPEQETYDYFIQHYGKQKAADILSNIRVIMAANIHGIALDALLSRLKGEKMKGSKFNNEFGISLGIVVMLPIAAIQVGVEKLFKNIKKN